MSALHMTPELVVVHFVRSRRPYRPRNRRGPQSTLVQRTCGGCRRHMPAETNPTCIRLVRSSWIVVIASERSSICGRQR